jgi:hypothetical protein
MICGAGSTLKNLIGKSLRLREDGLNGSSIEKNKTIQ